MPRNGQGIYTLPVGNPVITGTTITSTWGNTTMQDIANALTGSVASDGQTTMTGPLNMGSNRINNVDNPVLPQDAATMDYVDTAVGDLGTMARQNADNVQITGGSIQGVLLNLGGTTGQMYLPKGTTAQRTASPTVGLMRYNLDTIGNEVGFYEGYTQAGWRKFVTVNETSYDITYLIIAGGGGGTSMGGGGAGGLLTGSFSTLYGITHNIVIGGGGSEGTNGANSFITDIVTVIGGGRGSTGAGGSGGGGNGGYEGAPNPTPGGQGTPGQGYNGGSGGGHTPGIATMGGGGGGGGAGAVGQAGGYGGENNGSGGPGGIGFASDIQGSINYYGGGGGGGGGPSGASGGQGGGGNGGASFVPGTPGAANTGSGGGAGGYGAAGAGGGSGVCILRMPTANYSGNVTGSPVVTTVGDETVLKFTITGSYTA